MLAGAFKGLVTVFVDLLSFFMALVIQMNLEEKKDAVTIDHHHSFMW